MKPPSDSARRLLEQYRESITLGAEQKARLGGVVHERVLRGDAPRFDVTPAAQAAPEPSFIQQLWSSTAGKWVLGVLALGAAGGVGHQIVRDEPAPAAQVAHSAPLAPQVALAPPPVPEQEHAQPPVGEQQRPPAVSSNRPRVEKALPAPSAATEEPTIDEEVKLVNGAQSALRAGNSKQALELLAQHAARFPNGKLGTLRQVTQMMALCQAGQRAEARRQAAEFLARKPSSPFAERVKGICADAD